MQASADSVAGQGFDDGKALRACFMINGSSDLVLALDLIGKAVLDEHGAVSAPEKEYDFPIFFRPSNS